MRFVAHWHDRLPSTNTYLREWAAREPALPEGTVVAARAQEMGRGRRGRQWHCVPDRDLAFSLLVRPEVPHAALPSLPLCTALAVAEALEGFGVDARIKWPNDVRIQGKKLSGILIEAVPGALSPTLVVGVGLNVNATAADLAGIDQPATSLSVECGREFEVPAVLDAVLEAFAGRYAAWREGGFEGIREEWIACAEGIGAEVTVRDGDATCTGVMEGVGDNGALLLRSSSGELRCLMAGDLGI